MKLAAAVLPPLPAASEARLRVCHGDLKINNVVFAGDEGEEFFQAFRKAAERLPDSADWRSFPVPPGIQMLHATGAEPMWTVYAEKTPALIVMHLVLWRGEARVDYVGFFEELPEQPLDLGAYGPLPPLVPPRLPPPEGEAARLRIGRKAYLRDDRVDVVLGDLAEIGRAHV